MTNTESRIAIELEELALGEDADALEDAEQQITEADIVELAVYGFDSDKQTLVGLGPVERARRARRAAEIPDSQRAPQSESPGPFISDEDAIPPSLRRHKMGPWAVAAPALLLVAIAAVVALRGLAPHAPAPSEPAVAVAVQPPSEVPPPPPAELAPSPAELVATVDTVRAPEPAEARAAEQPTGAPGEVASRNALTNAPVALPVPARGLLAINAQVVVPMNEPVVPPALPVKLAELPPPTVVDLSSGPDANVGTINVTSNPPASVVVDGRPLGKAPCVVKVPAGLHTVVFIHPLYGRQSLSVNVSPSLTTTAAADF